MGMRRQFRNDLTLVKRAENEVPRAELLQRDCDQMFWELRELRQEAAALRKENRKLKQKNKKLEFENNLLFLSSTME
jgi:hypothetical protein